MNDELADYLIGELGFAVKPPARPGLPMALEAFLGQHLHQQTAIQRAAIDAIYDGADALLVSATASGKTEAVMIPLAARLLSSRERTVALYVAPTRALLNDLSKRLEAPLHQLGLETRVRHGDYPLPADPGQTRVLLITPESLDVELSKHTGLLGRVKHVVVDEVHQVFGTPRGDQLAFLLRRLECVTGGVIQRIALSATIGDPGAIASWLCPARDPARVIVAPATRKIIAHFRWLPELTGLRQLLETSKSDKVLCFASSRRRCDDVFLAMQGNDRLRCFVHYSTLTKEHREYVERGFKTTPIAACVATATLELGIDIGSIDEIVLIDPPTTVSSFLQRTGRGGRRERFTHVTITPQSPLGLVQFAALVRLAETGAVETVSAGHPYSVFVQQVFSFLAGKRRLCVHPDELVEQFGIFTWLTPDRVAAILESLVDKLFLRKVPGLRVYELGPRLEELIEQYAIFTNISPDSKGIPVYHAGRLIGNMPLQHSQIALGNVVLHGGRFWQITGVSNRGVTVEAASPMANPIRPVWGSKGDFAVSTLLAQGMRGILTDPPEMAQHDLDDDCSRQFSDILVRTAGLRSAGEAVWLERQADRYVYYTFAGALPNQILRLALQDAGFSCQPLPRAEGIAVASKQGFPLGPIPSDASGVNELVAKHWRSLASWISAGPFFDCLPPELKRDEVISKVVTAPVIEAVSRLSGTTIEPADVGLVKLRRSDA